MSLNLYDTMGRKKKIVGSLLESNPGEFWKRFWSRVVKQEGEDACWEWVGATWQNGRYGKVNSGGKHLRAYHLPWELENGKIPKGMCACHKCDNPACVRPSHIFIGSKSDNFKDMHQKGRAKIEKGTERYNSKLDPGKVREIRKLSSEGIGTCELSRRFNVNTGTIANIKNGTRWKHVRPLREI